MCRTMAKCVGCGRSFEVSEMVSTISRKRGDRVIYMCSECDARNQRYHAINEAILGTVKKNGVLCGIEMETSFSDEYARNAQFEYDFIATHDSSLRSEGEGSRYGWDGNTCEYVSPLMHGLNKASKYALTCQHLIDNGHMKVNSSCGTHFHVSINSMKDARGNKTYMGYIRRFYHSLFTPLTEAMLADMRKTEQMFGRGFGHYCMAINHNSNENSRYNWINVTNDSNIEFRLNRFVSGKQYQNLMKMEVEMTQCIVKNFCEHFMDTEWDRTRYEKRTHYRKHKASVTANKLVKIYQKYSNQ